MNPLVNQFEISVIIPIYNAATYIERCAHSLFEQSLTSIEYIFVDDYSTDGSIDVLKKTINSFPEIKQNIKIIHHEKNRGSAAARNTGLEKASGKYIAWTDADDYIDKDMFQVLHEIAEKENSDLVWCNFYLHYKNHQIEDHQLFQEDPKIISQGLIQGKIQGMLWNKLIKHKILIQNNIKFVEGYNMAEDRTFLFKVLYHCQKTKHIQQPLYYYVQSSVGSITRDPSMERVYEEIHNAQEILDYISTNNISWISKSDLQLFKFTVKSKLLFSTCIDDFIKWKKIFPESNGLTNNSKINIRHKLLAFCAINNRWSIIKVWIFFKKGRNSKLLF